MKNVLIIIWLKQTNVFFSTTKPINAPTMSLEEAVRVIQTAERARQGRLRAKLNRESRNMNWMYRTDDPGADVAERAAVCIQKVFNNHPTCSFLCPASLFFSKFCADVLCRSGGASYRGGRPR